MAPRKQPTPGTEPASEDQPVVDITADTSQAESEMSELADGLSDTGKTPEAEAAESMPDAAAGETPEVAPAADDSAAEPTDEADPEPEPEPEVVRPPWETVPGGRYVTAAGIVDANGNPVE